MRISGEAKELLLALRSPEGEVLRLVLPPEAEAEASPLAFRYGRGEGADQILQHAGRQVLRIDRSVREGGFDGSSVEVENGTLGVVPPSPGPRRTASIAGRPA